jgi:biotin synthase-related radical SAM superfamily protein
MKTDFAIRLADGKPALFHGGEEVCEVEFMPETKFYSQKTSSGTPFLGNSVLQGTDWVAFQCLWPCEYAMAGKPCQYCFFGGQFDALAKRNKPMPFIPSPQDVAEIVRYAIEKDGMNSIQLTGGSTVKAKDEEKHIIAYMTALNEQVGRENIKGEIILYITPPDDTAVIDRYFELGADRIACSFEIWDRERADVIMPGKHEFSTRERYLDALTYVVEKQGPGKALSCFIIGLESLETFKEGATYLAERGIIPEASIWMPFGKPVMESMKTPDIDYYRAIKEMLAELYMKYGLHPVGGSGVNVCVGKDIRDWAENSHKTS